MDHLPLSGPPFSSKLILSPNFRIQRSKRPKRSGGSFPFHARFSKPNRCFNKQSLHRTTVSTPWNLRNLLLGRESTENGKSGRFRNHPVKPLTVCGWQHRGLSTRVKLALRYMGVNKIHQTESTLNNINVNY